MGRARADVDLRTTIGSVHLPNPVMTAAGTAGHGAELAGHLDLAALGAHVVKSLSADPWPGNASPRVTAAGAGMLNAVGLQGPGVAAWLADDLPALAGVRVVASIWGRSVDEYRRAAEAVAAAGERVVAVEINLSCPNLEGRRGIFAHDPDRAAEVVAAVAVCARPRWAKLSANTDRIVEVARAVHAAGADAVTVANTLLGMVLDRRTCRPVLAAGGGGYSGPPIHPVAVRAVYDVHAALPELPIVGVGGVVDGWTAAELLAAGAQAVQVGTASFADPRAPRRVLDDLQRWLIGHGVRSLDEFIGCAHRADARPGGPGRG